MKPEETESNKDKDATITTNSNVATNMGNTTSKTIGNNTPLNISNNNANLSEKSQKTKTTDITKDKVELKSDAKEKTPGYCNSSSISNNNVGNNNNPEINRSVINEVNVNKNPNDEKTSSMSQCNFLLNYQFEL